MQVVCDALAAVVVFLIVIELLPLASPGCRVVDGPVATIFLSVLLLPDSLSVLPILLALCLIVRALGVLVSYSRSGWRPDRSFLLAARKCLTAGTVSRDLFGTS